MRIGMLDLSSKQGTDSEKLKLLGNNVGNDIFETSLNRIFNVKKYTYTQLDKALNSGRIDKFITTKLIYIRENAEIEWLQNKVARYDIPFIPISIGLQSPEFKSDFKLAKNVVDMLFKMQERAVLGIRGYYTAEILNKYGIKNINVIGCPSLYYFNNPYLQIYDRKEVSNFTMNFRTFHGGLLTDKEKEFLLYCAKHEPLFVEQTSNSIRANQAPAEEYKIIKNYLTEHSHLPLSAVEWRKLIRGLDFSMGCRFHGNIVSLWENMKSLFVTGDSRTQELVDFFTLPYIKIQDFNPSISINEYYDMADYHEFNKNYYSKFENFAKFCKDNELDISNCSVKQFMPR